MLHGHCRPHADLLIFKRYNCTRLTPKYPHLFVHRATISIFVPRLQSLAPTTSSVVARGFAVRAMQDMMSTPEQENPLEKGAKVMGALKATNDKLAKDVSVRKHPFLHPCSLKMTLSFFHCITSFVQTLVYLSIPLQLIFIAHILHKTYRASSPPHPPPFSPSSPRRRKSSRWRPTSSPAS